MTDHPHGSSKYVWAQTFFGWTGWALLAFVAYLLAIRPDPVVLESCQPVKVLKEKGVP